LLLNLSEDSIGIRFSGGASFWSDWYFDNESRLTRYFTDFGIKEPNSIQNIIIHTYWRKLNNIPVRFEEELQKWKNIEFLEEEAYKRKFQLDSINGIYIPKNIKECFLELDKLLSKEDIKKIKQLKDKSKTIAYHHGLGTWIRNNWGLWGGSRFQKYMEDRVEDQPDGWSGTILEFYWEWLNGINANWERFDKNAK